MMSQVTFVTGSVILKHNRCHLGRIHISPRHGVSIRTPLILRTRRLQSCSALQPTEKLPSAPKPKDARVALLSVAIVVFAVCNRVSHRIQLTGVMKDYTFFISQATTLAYTLIYAIILSARVHQGRVSAKQIKAARTSYLPVFATIGFLEAIVFSVQLYAAARLPGVLIGVLGQGLLPFTMLASILLLGKRYSFIQVLGVICVIIGVLTCTLPSASLSALTGENILFPAALFFFSCAVHSFAIVLKELSLQGRKSAALTEKAQIFDVFVVNSFGSAFQCLTVTALFPLTVALVTSLPPMQYMASGLNVFLTAPYMPWLTLIYITCNIAFNIVALSLVKEASASVALLAQLFSVPLVSLVFCLKLPLLTPSPFSWTICAGLAIIIFGFLLYNRQGSLNKS